MNMYIDVVIPPLQGVLESATFFSLVHRIHATEYNNTALSKSQGAELQACRATTCRKKKKQIIMILPDVGVHSIKFSPDEVRFYTSNAENAERR